MNLNPEQKQAVDHVNGPCIVTAVPGSGKTRTLTARVVNLIKQGVGPSNILCLTFTNKAANEMKERVATEIGELAASVWISTFHSFFLAVLRRYGKEVGLSPGFSIYGDGDQRELIEKIARMQGHETNRWGITCIMKAANDFREDIIEFETIAAELKPIEADIVKEYLEALKNFNAVDFSGILWQTYRLLKDEPKAAQVLAGRFKYILVDEWQDTNTIQYETIKLIASHNNIFVVGDPCQCLHSDEEVKVKGNDGHLRQFTAGEMPQTGMIKSYRNGKLVFQKYRTKKSKATGGMKIILQSGRSLSVSSNHRIYCTSIERGDNNFLVYLMYRPDLGFRIGTTHNDKTQYGHRMRQEGATKLWVLEVSKDKESALLAEQRISLEFKVPTVDW